MDLYSWYKKTNKIYLFIGILIFIIIIYFIYGYLTQKPQKKVSFDKDPTNVLNATLYLFYKNNCGPCIEFMKGNNGISEWNKFKERYEGISNNLRARRNINLSFKEIDVESSEFNAINAKFNNAITETPMLGLNVGDKWFIMDHTVFPRTHQGIEAMLAQL